MSQLFVFLFTNVTWLQIKTWYDKSFKKATFTAHIYKQP